MQDAEVRSPVPFRAVAVKGQSMGDGSEEGEKQRQLQLEAVIGMEGRVKSGLVVNTARGELVYPLGATVVIRSTEGSSSSGQEFLHGHMDRVSCLALSPSGALLATGQETAMGFTAEVILWHIPSRSLLHRMSLHKVKVESLSFSPCERYLASLGGQDDNALAVWETSSGSAICGSPTTHTHSTNAYFLRNDSTKLITSGEYNLTVWDFDSTARKLKPTHCNLGQLKRKIESVSLDLDSEYIYAGTQSGDVLKVSVKNKLLKNQGPAKMRIARGVLSTCVVPGGEVLVGGGDGSLVLLDPQTMKKRTSTRIEGSVTSISICSSLVNGCGNDSASFECFCATDKAEIFHLAYNHRSQSFSTELVQTCHWSSINDVCFPISSVFATCSIGEIRVWHREDCRELLRIEVPNTTCNCIAFMPDGRSIISGWSDSKIRAFAPQSGKMLYTINNAHQQGVTAIAPAASCKQILSGGQEGQVKVWRIGPQSQSMIATMKQHKGPVNQIVMRRNDEECVSASSDGSCILWDLLRFVRANSMFASTFFKAAMYHPEEAQVVATGTNRKITWYDVYDGQARREIEASESGEVSTLDVSADGEQLVSGGADTTLRLWNYDEGNVVAVGKCHSTEITKARISPDQRRVISTSADGAIMVWALPE